VIYALKGEISVEARGWSEGQRGRAERKRESNSREDWRWRLLPGRYGVGRWLSFRDLRVLDRAIKGRDGMGLFWENRGVRIGEGWMLVSRSGLGWREMLMREENQSGSDCKEY